MMSINKNYADSIVVLKLLTPDVMDAYVEQYLLSIECNSRKITHPTVVVTDEDEIMI